MRACESIEQCQFLWKSDFFLCRFCNLFLDNDFFGLEMSASHNLETISIITKQTFNSNGPLHLSVHHEDFIIHSQPYTSFF